jgi:hypothetical protein
VTSLLRIHASVASVVRLLSGTVSRLFALAILFVVGSLAP